MKARWLADQRTEAGSYPCIVKKYAQRVDIGIDGFCIHSLRSTAATNAVDHQANIAKVHEWLGHSPISTTRLYDERASWPEDSSLPKVMQ